MAKTKFGVTIGEKLTKEHNKIVEESKYLDLSRSEVVDAVLTPIFKSDVNQTKRTRELIIKKRKGKL